MSSIFRIVLAQTGAGEESSEAAGRAKVFRYRVQEECPLWGRLRRKKNVF